VRGKGVKMNENKPRAEADYTAVREYVRIDTSLPFRFTVMSEADYNLKREIYIKTKTINRTEIATQPIQVSPGEAVDPGLLKDIDPDLAKIWTFQIRMLVSIEKKLDMLANLLKAPAASHGNNVYEGKCKDMSGNGIAFFGNIPLKNGNLIEIKMSLPKLPPTPICLIGVVLKSEALPESYAKYGKYLTAVKFNAINEDDREEIVHFVLEKQREQIRGIKGR
jgi:hypothetical protein